MSHNSYNVIFTRAEVITDAKARLRCSGLNLTPKDKNTAYRQIELIGTEVFDEARTHREPEKFYVEELRRIEREEPYDKFAAANLLLEAALKIIYDKYQQLKDVLGE